METRSEHHSQPSCELPQPFDDAKNDSSIVDSGYATIPSGTPPILMLLRLEGLAFATLSAILYGHLGEKWWIFAVLWLVPDLGMFGYIAGPRWGAYCYNAMHTYIPAVALGAISLLFHHPALLPYALIWVNHIGVDRLLGYGLKSARGFDRTHLGHFSRRRY
jgi:hypothetical protein